MNNESTPPIEKEKNIYAIVLFLWESENRARIREIAVEEAIMLKEIAKKTQGISTIKTRISILNAGTIFQLILFWIVFFIS